jgi:hypothetical protein
MSINFGSSYCIGLAQPDSNSRSGNNSTPGQKNRLKAFATDLPAQNKGGAGSIVPVSSNGNIYISARKKFDGKIEEFLAKNGFKSYKKMDVDNVPVEHVQSMFKTGFYKGYRKITEVKK